MDNVLFVFFILAIASIVGFFALEEIDRDNLKEQSEYRWEYTQECTKTKPIEQCIKEVEILQNLECRNKG